ncbi:helix-turn-helix domain-containing protein [Allofranklinella schreckenbergeri]|uniref:Helix-turn-helix domain-containing protein n=2 Tax=Allofranklinella schreckenbergeri TaxID=1076744 RepID=A0A3M6QX52_9BURK|nr:helix-turn-helix domain-containing protein [Allofranklinella schreckenbergeri]
MNAALFMSEDASASMDVVATGLERPSVESLKTPGAWLRHYRLEREVSLEELAAVLKIPAGKLEALERDDYGQLPDMVFTRALAMTICRLLGYDSAPVMALFPQVHSPRLARDTDGINQPFKSTALPTPSQPAVRSGIPGSAIVLAIVMSIVAAIVFFWPQIEHKMGWGESSVGHEIASGSPHLSSQEVQVPALSAAASAESGTLAPALTPGQEQAPASEPTEAAPAAVAEPPVQEEQPAAPAESIRIYAQEPVWVQIRDASNAILHQSTLPKGREIAITNPPPLRVEIGRVDAVKVVVKGQPFNVQPFARGNVARFEVSP